MRNYFTFGEYDSRDFGVYISGEGTYNAPARVYNAISVPGRNGDLLIDEGKYENISIKYPAFIAGDNFRENLAAFRSAMLSTKGYARLTDTYHPEEYRRAYFGDQITVKARDRNDAGNFDIIFNCDPRRFLLSGDTPVPYPPGQEGGKNLLPFPYVDGDKTSQGVTFSVDNNGIVTASGQRSGGIPIFNLTNSNILTDKLVNGETYILSGCPEGGGQSTYRLSFMKDYTYTYDYGEGIEFVYDSSAVCNATIYIYASTAIENIVFKPMIRKSTDSDEWEAYYDSTRIYNPTLFESNPLIRVTGSGTLTLGDEVITVGSGYSYVDIDSEIQNCYCGLQNANSVVSFGSGKFPTLKPGITGISHSSGITSVQITPRWYRL